MLDPATLSAIVLSSTAVLGILAKFIHSLRNDIKSCFCITFRSPSNSVVSSSPKNKDIELSVIPPQLTKYLQENKLTLNQVVNDTSKPILV